MRGGGRGKRGEERGNDDLANVCVYDRDEEEQNCCWVRVGGRRCFAANNLVKSFKGWVNEVCKMVGLRLAIKAGSRLQKLLAMKRWKVGCMLVLNRRRYKRKLLLGWKRVVEWEKELLRVKMLKRYWMVVVGSCRGMMEKRRRVERGGRGVVVLRKGELLRAWRNSYKAELFRRGRGSRRRSLRLLARWKISR